MAMLKNQRVYWLICCFGDFPSVTEPLRLSSQSLRTTQQAFCGGGGVFMVSDGYPLVN